MEKFCKLAHRVFIVCAAVLMAMSFIGTLSAQTDRNIYTWTDEAGTRHFSAYPPQDTPYEIVEGLTGVRTATPASPTEAAAAGELPEIPEMRETQPDPEIVAARCEQARTNLNLLRQDRPAVLQSEEGEPMPLEGERRQQMIAETEAFIDEWC